MLTLQLKKLSDDLRRATRQLNSGAEEKKDLSSKIGESVYKSKVLRKSDWFA